VARHPGWLNPGAIGCALSHRRAYEEIRSSLDDVALVLEDDVTLPPWIAGLCARVGSEMEGREIVLLYFRAFGVCRFSARDAVDLSTATRLMYPIDAQQPITAAAYLISRAAARSLSEAIVPVRAAADSWGTTARSAQSTHSAACSRGRSAFARTSAARSTTAPDGSVRSAPGISRDAGCLASFKC
jgi:glycosyl transferase family 25